jgi:hypothetical protein
MSQDLDVPLHCHCNFPPDGEFSRGGILRRLNSALEERELAILAYFSIVTYRTGAKNNMGWSHIGHIVDVRANCEKQYICAQGNLMTVSLPN